MNENTLNIIVIIAIIVGPIGAVLVTRIIDSWRLKRSLRMDVFRDLMRTRRMRLSQEHVGALNLVEIEFNGEKKVIEAWKAYMNHLNSTPPSATDQDAWDKRVDEQEVLLTTLLHQIAQSLKFNIQQLDIFKGGYYPQYYDNVENQQHTLRLLLIDTLKGNRPIPVTNATHPAPSSPYPPPPEKSQ